MKKIAMILALDEKNGLGKGGDLAWRIPEDMKNFKKITQQTQDPTKINAVVMGRKTWDSIPDEYRPLPGRVNAVLSRNFHKEDSEGNICMFCSFEAAIEKLSLRDDIEKIFIIGGAQIYNLSLQSKRVSTLYLTRVEGDHGCDVYMDGDFEGFENIDSGDWQRTKSGIGFKFEKYNYKHSMN